MFVKELGKELYKKVVVNLPKTDKPVISILSGGLDSTILTYILNNYYSGNVICLSFDYNQRHSIELEKAKLTCTKLNIPHKIIPINFFGDLVSNVCSLTINSSQNIPNIKDVLGNPQPNTCVPYRNMLFLTLALSFAESNNSENIFIGIQAHDLYGYWDTTPSFIEAMNNVSKLNRLHQIMLRSPFVNLAKKDEIAIGEFLNIPFEDTWTCYDPRNEVACGSCGSCAERIKNFMDLNLRDPIPYIRNIPWN